MEQIKVGIIGVGNMGSTHAKNLLDGNVPGMRLTAAADLREEIRSITKKSYGDSVKIFTDGRELIDSGACDAVIVATPHYQHPELVMYALEKGLHAMSEKPAGVYTKQVREMNEAAKKSDKVFAIMFNQRTNCIYRKMYEMIQNGALGEIKRVNWIITDWYRTQDYYNSGGWRATWDGEGGGVLINQCPHNLDLIQWLCGMPSKVRAFCHYGKWHDIEVEDDVTAYFEYPNGATGVFITTTADAPGTNRLEVTGNMGKLVCENDKLIFHRLNESEREFCKTGKGFGSPGYTIEEIETDGINEQHIGVLKSFAGKILKGTTLIADGTEGIRGLTLSNAIHLSSWLDRTVDIPFNEDLFLDELNKRRATSVKKEGNGSILNTEGTY